MRAVQNVSTMRRSALALISLAVVGVLLTTRVIDFRMLILPRNNTTNVAIGLSTKDIQQTSSAPRTVIAMAARNQQSSTKANTTAITIETVPATTTATKFGVVLVNTSGNLLDRVRQFNVYLDQLRHDELVGQLTKPWVAPGPKINVVGGAMDDYVQLLSNYSHVKTIALPWLWSKVSPIWNSLTDTSNVLIQKYYEWTADDPLCKWIETPGTTRLKFDAVFNRTCSRNITDTAKPKSLAPVFLNAKQFTPNEYWPNDGNFYPQHFYTTPPPFVFYIHIHRDAIANGNGDVFGMNLKLALYGCSYDRNPALPFSGNPDQLPFYDEVFVITQYWGTSVFHRMVEIVPRLAVHLDFLKNNQNIRILAPEGPGGRLGELVRILGLDESRLVTGTVRAKVVYLPRVTSCGYGNVQENQILNSLYLDYIRMNFPTRPRNRLVFVRRTGLRRFTEQKTIEEAVERAARDFNLTYTLFPDNPTPSLNDTMMMFQSAVVVVAPHGAGLSNILFSEPGTFVVEGVCNLPHVNLCFQRLASVLGMHWHGVPSRDGCEDVVDASTASLDRALRSHLRLWSRLNQI